MFHLLKIKQILDRMETSVHKSGKYRLSNRHFHLMIYSCADSPMLLQLIYSIMDSEGRAAKEIEEAIHYAEKECTDLDPEPFDILRGVYAGD
jgi:DNA-binding GntR family transcriptional regulator